MSALNVAADIRFRFLCGCTQPDADKAAGGFAALSWHWLRSVEHLLPTDQPIQLSDRSCLCHEGLATEDFLVGIAEATAFIAIAQLVLFCQLKAGSASNGLTTR
jgi:hypothetical protein